MIWLGRKDESEDEGQALTSNFFNVTEALMNEFENELKTENESGHPFCVLGILGLEL